MTGLQAALSAWVENVREGKPPPHGKTDADKAINQVAAAAVPNIEKDKP